MTSPSPDDALRIEHGQPYPEDQWSHKPGSMWVPEVGVLFGAQPGLRESEIEAWGARTRVFFTTHKSQIVASVQYLNSVQVEFPGTRAVGSEMPDWVADDTNGHLFLRIVYVDSITGIVVRLSAFTVSPHATKVLRADALTRWAEPVTPQQATEDYISYQARYPTEKAVRAAAMVSCRPGD